MNKQILCALIFSLSSTTQTFAFPRFTTGFLTGLLTSYLYSKNQPTHIPKVLIDGKSPLEFLSDNISKNCKHDLCTEIAKALNPQQKTIEEKTIDIVDAGTKLGTEISQYIKKQIETTIEQPKKEQNSIDEEKLRKE